MSLRDCIVTVPNLEVCSSNEEAEALPGTARFDLVLCTLQFDDSQWADFLRLAKGSEHTRMAPFVILKVLQGLLSDTHIDTSLVAAKLIGADATVNLPAWRREYGDDEAYQKLRQRIRSLWWAEGRVRHVER